MTAKEGLLRPPVDGVAGLVLDAFAVRTVDEQLQALDHSIAPLVEAVPHRSPPLVASSRQRGRGCRCARPSGRVGALPLGGLALLDACCFVGAAGGIAGAVRMSADAR